MIHQVSTRRLESAALTRNKILPTVQDFDVELEIEHAPEIKRLDDGLLRRIDLSLEKHM